MNTIRKLTAALLALALLLLAGCKQQGNVPQSRALSINSQAGETAAPADSAAENTDPGQSALTPEDLGADLLTPEQALGQSDEVTHELLERQEGDVIEITERLFVAQTNDIYLNAQDYLGKTLVYEGIYKADVVPGEDGEPELIHYVIRYGPGCCGFDDNAGFEVTYAGGYPLEDAWVEVVGTLVEYEMGGWKYLRVDVQSLDVKTERGAEYVAS